jgi:hypothetical protein
VSTARQYSVAYLLRLIGARYLEKKKVLSLHSLTCRYYDTTMLFAFTESSSNTSIFPLSNISQFSGMELGKDGSVQNIMIGHLHIQQII